MRSAGRRFRAIDVTGRLTPPIPGLESKSNVAGPMSKFNLQVNGRSHEVDVAPETPLLLGAAGHARAGRHKDSDAGSANVPPALCIWMERPCGRA